MKVTTPNDLALAETHLRARLGESRTGMGYDVHRFAAGDHLWLWRRGKCRTIMRWKAIRTPMPGLHALTDAILGRHRRRRHRPALPAEVTNAGRGAPSWKIPGPCRKSRARQGRRHCPIATSPSSANGRRSDLIGRRCALAIAEILKLDLSRVSVKATHDGRPRIRRPTRGPCGAGGGDRPASVSTLIATFFGVGRARFAPGTVRKRDRAALRLADPVEAWSGCARCGEVLPPSQPGRCGRATCMQSGQAWSNPLGKSA